MFAPGRAAALARLAVEGLPRGRVDHPRGLVPDEHHGDRPAKTRPLPTVTRRQESSRGRNLVAKPLILFFL
jgi:hypothetical protein